MTTPAVPGGNNPNASGATDTNSNDPSKTPTTPPVETTKETVSYESHQKLLGEKKKRDAENAELKARLDAIEAKAQADAVEAATKKGDTEMLLKLEREKTAKAELKAKENQDALTDVNSRLERGAKMRAFLGSVNGAVDEQYWPLVNLDGIKINPETGMPDAVTVQAAAREFEKNYPLVLKSKSNPATLPGDAPRGGGAKLSYEEWLKLPLKEQKARMREVTQ